MSVQLFLIRLFGGHDLAVSYDSGAQTLTILAQMITIASLPAALQAQWQAAISGAGSGVANASRPAFGGDNIGAAAGAILDNQPAWRSAIQAALATVVAQSTLNGAVAGIETFNR